ncbi:hypothetical protein BH09PSE1_BH09PSE1_08540 [soil metagenome]
MDVLYLHQKLSKTRLDQRCVELDSGDILFDAPDKRGPVRFSASEWEAVRADHEARLAPARRFFKWSMWLNGPIALGLIIAMILFVPNFGAMTRWLDRAIPPQLGVGLILTWPALIGFIVNARATILANNALDSLVAGMARETSVVLPKRRLVNWLEVTGLILVGPHLFLGAYGTLRPEAFANTPLSGTRLGLIDVVGICVMLALIAIQRRRKVPVHDPVACAPSSAPVEWSGQPVQVNLASAPAPTFGRRTWGGGGA